MTIPDLIAEWLRRTGETPHGIVGRWYVTESAVHDYQWCLQRLGQELDFGTAQGDLIDLSTVARHIRDQRNGLQLWRAPGKPRLRLLVSLRTREEDDRPVLVKVLPEHGEGRARVGPRRL